MRTTFVLLILGLVWAVALIPPLLRSRADSRPAASITTFRTQLSHLSRVPGPGPRHGAPVRAFRASGQQTIEPVTRPQAGGGYPYGYGVQVSGYSPAREVARRRRQNVLLTLLVVAGLTGIGWLGLGIQIARPAFFVVAALLVVYVYLLVLVRRNEELRQAPHEPAGAARRAA